MLFRTTPIFLILLAAFAACKAGIKDSDAGTASAPSAPAPAPAPAPNPEDENAAPPTILSGAYLKDQYVDCDEGVALDDQAALSVYDCALANKNTGVRTDLSTVKKGSFKWDVIAPPHKAVAVTLVKGTEELPVAKLQATGGTTDERRAVVEQSQLVFKLTKPDAGVEGVVNQFNKTETKTDKIAEVVALPPPPETPVEVVTAATGATGAVGATGGTGTVAETPAPPIDLSGYLDHLEAGKDNDCDGVLNGDDKCNATPAVLEVNGVCATMSTTRVHPAGSEWAGCGENEVKDFDDNDGDAIANNVDECPGTLRAAPIDDKGCAEGQESIAAQYNGEPASTAP